MLKDSSIHKIKEDNEENRESFYLTHTHINIDSSPNLLRPDAPKLKSSLFANLVKSQLKQMNAEEANQDYIADDRVVLPPLNAQSHVSFDVQETLKSAITTARGGTKPSTKLLLPGDIDYPSQVNNNKSKSPQSNSHREFKYDSNLNVSEMRSNYNRSLQVKTPK